MQVSQRLCLGPYLRFNLCLLNCCLEYGCHQVICQGILEASALGLQPGDRFELTHSFCQFQSTCKLPHPYPADGSSQGADDDHIVC